MKDGIFQTPRAELFMGSGTNTPAHIISIRTEVGNSIGTAVLRYELLHGESGMATVGNGARISLDGSTVFRGSVGYSELIIDGADDLNEIMLVDDRRLMMRLVVGQPGIFTKSEEAGFTDVGWDIVFNPDGVPNKNPDELDFKTGSTAEYWTLRTMLEMVVEQWCDDSISLNTGSLSAIFDNIPSSVTLTGMTGLQAVDQIFQMGGSDWCLDYGGSGSKVEACGSGGITRTVNLWAPKGGGRAEASGFMDVGTCRFRNRVLDSFDEVSAVSGNVIVETTYKSSNGLLYKDEGFKSKQYALRFRVDVSMYSANGLGQDLSAGSIPKPWLQRLVTRMNDAGSGYLTAAAMAANLSLINNDQPEFKLWVEVPEDEETKKYLVVGNADIDADNGMIFLKGDLEVAAAGGKVAQLVLTDAMKAAIEVELTIATVTDMRRSHDTGNSGSYLPDHFRRLIEVTALTPQVRYKSMLPNLATDEPADAEEVAAGAEDYVDVADRLQEAAEAELEASPKVENSGRIELLFMPVLSLGNGISVAGRVTGMSGIYVRAIDFNVHREYSTVITVGNVAASKPSRDFIGQGSGGGRSFDMGGMADLGVGGDHFNQGGLPALLD